MSAPTEPLARDSGPTAGGGQPSPAVPQVEEPPAAPADPLASLPGETVPAPAPTTSDQAPQPEGAAAPKPPPQKPRRNRPKKTVVDVVSDTIDPWIEARDQELLVTSLRVDELVTEGQVRLVDSAIVEGF